MRMLKDTIKNIALEIRTGKTPPTSNPEYFGEDVDWYTPSDLDKEKYLGKSRRGITDKAIVEKKAIVFKSQTVLIGAIGDIGKLGITSNISSSNQQITGIYTNPDKVDAQYLYYWLKANKNLLIDKAKSAIVPILNNKDLGQIKVSFPEKLSDQLHIANILSKAENLIAQRKESIRLLDEFLKSKFAEMFIDRDFPHHKLGDLATKITDGEHKKPEYIKEGMPFISVKNITNGFLDFNDCKYVSVEDFNKFTKRCKPEFGDIIYTKVGATYGRACVVDTEKPFCLYVSVALIKPKKELVLPKFLQYAINHPYVKRQADKSIKGSGVPDLHLIEIKSFEIPLPSIELQTQFAQIVDKTEALKTQYQQSLQELENLYGSLSQRAFRGELSVKHAVSL